MGPSAHAIVVSVLGFVVSLSAGVVEEVEGCRGLGIEVTEKGVFI